MSDILWQRLSADLLGILGRQLEGVKDGALDTHIFGKCESPIEVAFAAAVVFQHRIIGSGLETPFESPVDLPSGDHVPVTHFFMPQVQFDNYRVDFILGWQNGGGDAQMSIAIECDGHDFHERTKEQAQRDKARDRYLATRVAGVLRFTGSEIYQNPIRCANEAFFISREVFEKWWASTHG